MRRGRWRKSFPESSGTRRRQGRPARQRRATAGPFATPKAPLACGRHAPAGCAGVGMPADRCTPPSRSGFHPLFHPADVQSARRKMEASNVGRRRSVPDAISLVAGVAGLIDRRKRDLEAVEVLACGRLSATTLAKLRSWLRSRTGSPRSSGQRCSGSPAASVFALSGNRARNFCAVSDELRERRVDLGSIERLLPRDHLSTADGRCAVAPSSSPCARRSGPAAP